MSAKELAAAAERGAVSTNVLNLVTGLSRSTFSYWFRKPSEGRREPRPYRVALIQRLTKAINRAVDAGDLPADSPQEAADVIRRWMDMTK
jgi:hypothetical protein